MRIIAGEHRGRRIVSPAGTGTRPMLDRVREALFSTLGDWIPGAGVLDLFAGSGSLGLEALSRGARRARLVEQDKAALAALRKNVAALRLEERAEVRASDALSEASWRAPEPWDVVFLDPPYALVRDPRGRKVLLTALGRLLGGFLASDGALMLHVERGALREGEIQSPGRVEVRAYGSSSLVYVFPDRGEA